MGLDPAVSIPAFSITFLVLIIFGIIVFRRKWKAFSGKIFTLHMVVKLIWFLGIFLLGFRTNSIVFSGAILFIIGTWGLGLTMLWFVFSITKTSEFTKKFMVISLMVSIAYFMTFLIIPAFHLVPTGVEGESYLTIDNYFFIPGILMTCSYYYTIIIFFLIAMKSTGKQKRTYLIFAFGLLLHSINGHALAFAEFIFGVRNAILNLEYLSMIGFAIALYAYITGIKEKQ